MMAQQEELGDLKLYRIPEPVTVAAKSQKQVALLKKAGVKVRTVYRSTLAANQQYSGAARRILITRNEAAQGLGLPLPSGRVVLFARGAERPVLIGRGFLADKAVGEEVEIEVGTAADLQVRLRPVERDSDGGGTFELTVTNARPVAAPFELELEPGDFLFSTAKGVGRRNGRPLIRITVPANGTSVLTYTLKSQRN